MESAEFFKQRAALSLAESALAEAQRALVVKDQEHAAATAEMVAQLNTLMADSITELKAQAEAQKRP